MTLVEGKVDKVRREVLVDIAARRIRNLGINKFVVHDGEDESIKQLAHDLLVRSPIEGRPATLAYPSSADGLLKRAEEPDTTVILPTRVNGIPIMVEHHGSKIPCNEALNLAGYVTIASLEVELYNKTGTIEASLITSVENLRI